MDRARELLISKIEVIRAELEQVPDCPEKGQMEELLREMERIVGERLR